MRFVDFNTIIRLAWAKFNSNREIEGIEDVSAKVSTNHVFKVSLTGGGFVIAKLSHFGRHEYFVEDHKIINALANNLLFPFDQFIARSLIKGNEVFTYRYKRSGIDVWVVFYNPVRIKKKLPKKLDDKGIRKVGRELARFHLACQSVASELPESSKSMKTDLIDFKNEIISDPDEATHTLYKDEILWQCDLFLENSVKLGYDEMERIPVFVDWNIGNFSVDSRYKFYSRWDYDWFRVSPRAMDFYFWARVVREEGDQTVFSYLIDPLMEENFVMFLKAYHSIYPLTENEILFIKEAYRFFILHYVVRLGNYFFLSHYAQKLINEAFTMYFRNINKFDANVLLKILK